MIFETGPYLWVENETVVKVTPNFLDFTGYEEAQIKGKQLSEISSLLRLTYRYKDIESLPDNVDAYVFTKTLEVRDINIIKKQIPDSALFIVGFFEKPNSRLAKRFPLVDLLNTYSLKGIGIFTVTPEIILLNANDVFLKFFDWPGNSRKYSIGRPIHQIIKGWVGSTSEKIWKDIVATGKPFKSKEFCYTGFDRGPTYWQTTMVPIIEMGHIKYVIEMTEDISENVAKTRQLIEQAEIINKQKQILEENLRMKDQLISVLSHEFKTPLAVINSAIQAMEVICRDEMTENIHKYIKRIKQNALRQLRLVNNFLDISRHNAGRLPVYESTVDIVFLTRSIVDSIILYAQQKQIRIHFKSSVAKRLISIDDEKYERILLNLLSNAIKYSHNGKDITVSLNFRTIEQEKVFEIKIDDNGIGIPKDKIDTIFERFQRIENSLTCQAEGTGIGLTLVKLLVDLMGGKISVESEEGLGTCFTLVLPAKKLSTSQTPATCDEISDRRLLQAASIECSDIY